MRPAAVAIATFAAALFLWTRFDARFYRTGDRPLDPTSIIEWVAPGMSPVTVRGRPEDATFVAVGDSRAWRALDLETIERGGVGQGALLWYGGGDLEVLLRAALELPPARLLVTLSPHSLHPAENRLIGEMMRSKPIPFEATATRRDVLAWAEAERTHLVAQGFPPAAVAIAVGRIVDGYERRCRAQGFSTALIDRRLAYAVDRFRAERVGTIMTRIWVRRWIAEPDPSRSNVAYSRSLRAEFAPERAAGAARVEALLRRAVDEGWDVACVRLPISTELRAVEDSTVPPELLSSIPGDLGLPFRDYGGGAFETADGSHLTWGSALAFGRDLAAWLRDDVGWTAHPGPHVTTR